MGKIIIERQEMAHLIHLEKLYHIRQMNKKIFHVLSLTTLKLVLHDAIFLETCLAALKKEIHCMFQKTCQI